MVRSKRSDTKGKAPLPVCLWHDKPHAATELEAAYSSSLRQHAIVTTFFEGEYRLETMRFFDRMILQLLIKVKESLRRTYNETVKDFADKIVT